MDGHAATARQVTAPCLQLRQRRAKLRNHEIPNRKVYEFDAMIGAELGDRLELKLLDLFGREGGNEQVKSRLPRRPNVVFEPRAGTRPAADSQPTRPGTLNLEKLHG